jgi:ATP-binding cassette subfamily F protein uup
LQRYEELKAAGPGPDIEKADFRIPTGPRLGTKVLELKGVTKALGGKTLFAGLDLSVQPGDIIGVVGRNGLGKSTLVRLILGQEKPDAGIVEFGVNTKMVYAEQGRGRLNPERSMVEELSADGPNVVIDNRVLRVEQYLQMFGFEGEVQRTAIGRLSGGERNRVQLAKMLRGGGNLLILDEPTNDLDLDTLRVLEDAIDAFAGSAIVVSHDRWFLNRLCSHILAFEGAGVVHLYSGDYDDFRATKARQAEASPKSQVPSPKSDAKGAASAATKATAAPATAAPAPAAKKKLSWKEQKELETIESDIAAAEGEVAAVDALLADPALYTERVSEVAGLVARQKAAAEKVARLYSRWEELEALKG